MENTTETHNYRQSPGQFYDRLLLELFTTVSVVSFSANVFVIFAILRFQKLRRAVSNLILLHLNLTQAVYLLVTPFSFRMFRLLGYFPSDHLFCVFVENKFILCLIISLFLYLLVCDWYLKTYNEARYGKFCRVYGFFVLAIYVAGLFLSVTATSLCFRDLKLVASVLPMFFVYVILVVFLLTMSVVHLCKRGRLEENRNNAGLVIADMFFVFWIPFVVVLFMHLFVYFYSPELIITTFVVGFLSPIFNFFYLFLCVDDFNVFFRRIFSCQCNAYGNEILEEQTVIYNNVNGVKIDRNQC